MHYSRARNQYPHRPYPLAEPIVRQRQAAVGQRQFHALRRPALTTASVPAPLPNATATRRPEFFGSSNRPSMQSIRSSRQYTHRPHARQKLRRGPRHFHPPGSRRFHVLIEPPLIVLKEHLPPTPRNPAPRARPARMCTTVPSLHAIIPLPHKLSTAAAPPTRLISRAAHPNGVTGQKVAPVLMLSEKPEPALQATAPPQSPPPPPAT